MKEYCFGIDVGGTTIKIGFFKNNGEVLDKWEITTRTENFGENILADICEALEGKLVKEGISLDEIEGIGIGLPGPVLADGTVLQCVNLGWGTFNVEQKLSEMFHGIKVKAGNDANVAALGEMWQGAGKGTKNMVMVTLGTGVGGGVIVNGQIVAGAHGAGGEIGHIPVRDDEQLRCGCGKSDCLEMYASATGIVSLTKRALAASDRPSSLRALPEQSAKDTFDAAKAGDALALEIVEEFGEILGRGLAEIAGVVDPQTFVIGGGVSKAGTIILDVVKKYYARHAFHACRDVEFQIARLGNDAGIYGCVQMIL